MSTQTLEKLLTEMASTTAVSQTIEQLDALAENYNQETLFVFFDSFKGLADACQGIVSHYLSSKHFDRKSEDRKRDLQLRAIEELKKVLNRFTKEQLPIIQQYLQVGSQKYLLGLRQIIAQTPERLQVEYPSEVLTANERDSLEIRRTKWSLRMQEQWSGKQVTGQIRFKKLLEKEWQVLYLPNFLSFLTSLSLVSSEILQKLEKKAFEALPSPSSKPSDSTSTLQQFSAYLDEQQIKLAGFLPEFHQLLAIRLENELKQVNINRQNKLVKNLTLLQEQKIKQTSADWHHNQLLAHERFLTNLNLQKIRIQILWLTKQIEEEIQSKYLDVASKTLKKIKENLDQIPILLEVKKLGEYKSFDVDKEEFLIISDNRITERGLAHLRGAIGKLEELIPVASEQSSHELEAGKRSRLVKESFPLAESVSYFTKMDYLAPIEGFLKELPITFKKIHELILGVDRIVSFTLKTDESSLNSQSIEEMLEQVQYAMSQADSIHSQTQNDLSNRLQESQQKVLEVLCLSQLLYENKSGRLMLRQGPPIKGFTYVKNQSISFIRGRLDWINSLWRRTQDDRILAEFEAESQKNPNSLALLREFADFSRPNEAVQAKLPFYYKQLFTGRQRITQGMLAHCENEIHQARQAAQRMEAGNGGGLLVVGEALSGKSLFSEYVAELLFSAGNVYRIVPPIDGSTQRSDLLQAFRRQLKRKGTLRQMIQGSPRGSVFLMDDLELWWERSNEGDRIMRQIFDLIEQHGQDYYFVANCNVHFYQLFSQYAPFDVHFSTTIWLSPFSSTALKQTILNRHSSGRFSYLLDGVPEEEVSPQISDLFFSRILSISKGNVGFALRLWLRQIQVVDGDRIYLQMPEEPKVAPIHNADWLVLLGQFVLHKRLTIPALVRIFEGETEAKIQEMFYPLQQIGILRTVSKHVYEIDPNLQPFIVQQLIKAKII